MAMAEGMHTQMPIEYLGEPMVQRCRKIWWTVYILDREMTSLMGLPQSLSDNHVNTLLPEFPGSIQRTAAIGMHIKLSRIIAEINGCMFPASIHVHDLTNSLDSRLCYRWTLESELPDPHQNRTCQDRQRGR